MDFSNVTPFEKGLLNVIIETPKGSADKYDFDPALGLFHLKKTLPLGTVFPFDFGFLPRTLGGDGDPLDVLVIAERPAWPGCLIPCRPLGVLRAEQKEKGKGKSRNDRIIAISATSLVFGHISKLKELGDNVLEGITQFFIDYNKNEGKTFTPLGWGKADEVIKFVKHKTI